MCPETNKKMKKTKKEWVEWFKSLDDNVEIELIVSYRATYDNSKVKQIRVYL